MKMLISEYNSKKITVLNTLLIVFVLLLHSYYTEASIYPISQSIQLITGAYGLTGIAVPMFFMLSGMLFFNGIFTVKDCFPKMKKRVRSLLIPYILWNIFFVVWYVILQNLPGLSASINNNITGKVFTPNIISNIYELFWTPVNFPLWFLRDLIVMVAISPILYYVIKYLKWFAPIIVLSLSPFVHLPISSFFLLGGCIAMHSSLDVVSVKVVGGGHILAGSSYICRQCDCTSFY